MRGLVICVALLGCRDREVAELERIGDTVCTCQTSKCAEAALKEVPQDEQRSTPRTQQLARRMLDCLAKLYDKERDQSEGSGSSD